MVRHRRYSSTVQHSRLEGFSTARVRSRTPNLARILLDEMREERERTSAPGPPRLRSSLPAWPVRDPTDSLVPTRAAAHTPGRFARPALLFPRRFFSLRCNGRHSAERLINEGDVAVAELEILLACTQRQKAARTDEERRVIFLGGQRELRRRGFNALLEPEIQEIMSDKRGGLFGIGCKRPR